MSTKHKYLYAICIICIATVVKTFFFGSIFFVYNNLRLFHYCKQSKNTTQHSMLWLKSLKKHNYQIIRLVGNILWIYIFLVSMYSYFKLSLYPKGKSIQITTQCFCYVICIQGLKIMKKGENAILKILK